MLDSDKYTALLLHLVNSQREMSYRKYLKTGMNNLILGPVIAIDIIFKEKCHAARGKQNYSCC